MSSIGQNAQFLNQIFGATPAEDSTELSLIAIACPHAERKNIASGYLSQKFASVSKQIDDRQILLNSYGQAELAKAKKLVAEGQVDAFSYLGILFNHAAAPFKTLFSDFNTHLSAGVDELSKMIASTGGKMTPLPKMIEAGVDSAVHIWEAILKSLLVKEGSSITLDQFKQAYEKSKELLLDITDIPLQVLSTLESYLFKREKGYDRYTASDQANERMGSNVRHEAISYEKETGAVKLDQEFMSTDGALAKEKAKLDKVANESHYKIHSCAGKQMIPLLFKYMDQIFEEHLFSNFDEIIAKTKFA